MERNHLEQINEISKHIFDESVDMFDNMEKLKKEIKRINMITLNIKINTAHMNTAEGRALAKSGEIISNALNEMIDEVDSLEVNSGRIKEFGKQIGSVLNGGE